MPLQRVWTVSLLALSLTAPQLCAQFTTTLQPRTVAEYDRYAVKVEQQLSSRWHGNSPFLSIDDKRSEHEQVLQGDLVVRPGTSENPVAISNGLIHDWVGSIFIPNTTTAKVLAVLQDFDHHSQIYPEIISSHLTRRDGNDLWGYWRLQRKDQLVPVILDVNEEAHYQEIGPGKWTCRAYAKDISEVESPGTSHEKKWPAGQGTGFLWRLYAYWSIEAANDGVFAECRTLSLSRSIPVAFVWAIKPFVQALPRESLASTLRNTRTAATK